MKQKYVMRRRKSYLLFEICFGFLTDRIELLSAQ